jgi:hypothetical protein
MTIHNKKGKINSQFHYIADIKVFFKDVILRIQKEVLDGCLLPTWRHISKNAIFATVRD